MRLIDAVDGVREEGAGGRALNAGVSLLKMLGSTFKIGPVFSEPGAVPARRGGGIGGGLGVVMDGEDGDGCAY